MSVLLAIAAAASYGFSDFVGGVASRRSSVWPVGLLACVGALIGSLALALLVDGDPNSADFAWALLAGVGSGLGTAILYRGYARGQMAVVSPLSAVGAVLVPLAAGLVAGERPAALGWIGIVVAVPAILLVSSAEEPAVTAAGPTSSPGFAAGVSDGLVAGASFGLLFAALGQVPDRAGYWPLVGTQTMAVAALLAAALLMGGSPLPRRAMDLWGLLAGALASVAIVFFLLAANRGLLSVAAVITSLYPAFTVLPAVVLLRERIHRGQGVGLALCAAAIACISAG